MTHRYNVKVQYSNFKCHKYNHTFAATEIEHELTLTIEISPLHITNVNPNVSE